MPLRRPDLHELDTSRPPSCPRQVDPAAGAYWRALELASLIRAGYAHPDRTDSRWWALAGEVASVHADIVTREEE